jgi:hypothetical protein
MKDFIQLNKFGEVHNGETIFFCKTDYIYKDFESIKKIKNNVILITGNSDYPITDSHVNQAPKNITKWFAQNAISKNPIIEPLPLGIENKIENIRKGHGVGYFERVKEKEFLLNRDSNVIPEKFIYSNFNLNTNYSQRIIYKNISKNTNHIDWEENNLTLENFFNKILDYKMILCPIGNGIDTHRLWETLYSDRIPIIVKHGEYKIYELYEKLPIIILDNINQLTDKDYIQNKYEELTKNKFDKSILTFLYWKDKIINYE